ncbi:MAG TPA: AraC family transcriptional regulator [Aliidongia sp.]|nr:AraC family transcriptional regulator [Aliidongia sp.]
MDPLSDVLSLLKPRSYMFGGFEAGGDWSIHFGQHAGIKCYAVASGQCWLSVEGVAEAVLVKTGDCFLLPRGLPFRVASDLALPSVDARSFFPVPSNGGIASLNGGGDFSIVGGHFVLGGDHAGILLGMLPPIAHIRKEADKAALRWSMERMRQELRERQPGGFLVAQHLAYMMLVQALRLHLTEGLDGGVGWLFALADKQIGAAIGATHADPAQRWTLQNLAERAGMSRSSFALRFKETVGTPPLEYLTRWRMLLAGDRLTNSRDSVAVIALALGYESESAFSTAFKRVMGCSPRQYGSRDNGHGRDAAASSRSEREAARADRPEPVAG